MNGLGWRWGLGTRWRLAAAVGLAATTAGGAELVLARDGQPAATIVLPAEAPPRLAEAAADLQRYVAARCGVTLPLATDGTAVAGVGLYLGDCAPTQAADLPAEGLNPEAYRLVVRDGNLFFTGRWPTPVAFAVSDFIATELGVAWFAPGELWEDVPAGEPGRLVVQVTERQVVPDTSPRVWSGHAWVPSWQDWNRRNRTLLSEVVPRRQFQNRIHQVFDPAKYGASHPEWFPLVRGQRLIPEPGNRYWRPCESNPAAIAHLVQFIRTFFDANPLVDSFSLGMDDIVHMCGCDGCRANDPDPAAYAERRFSDRHYWLVNTVAREIAKTHPDRFIGTLIYSIARALPTTIDRLEPNVFGFITETSARWWDPAVKQADQALTAAWAQRCQHLSRYDYYGMGGLTPRYYPHLVDEQMKYDKSLGVEGMYIEVYTMLPHTLPMIWAVSQLQWDTSQDIDQLLETCLGRLFGAAAGTMAEYWQLLETAWCTPRPGRTTWVHRRLDMQALAMDPAQADAALRLLDRALAEADSERVRERIKVIQAAMRYSAYIIWTRGLNEQLAAQPIRSLAEAEAAVKLLRRAAILDADRERDWSAALERDDILGETLRGLRGMKYLSSDQIDRLKGGTNQAVGRFLQFALAQPTADRDQLLGELAGIPAAGGVSRLIAALDWSLRTQPANLVRNGDFETGGENQQPAELDWQTTGAPVGWSTWSRAGQARFLRQGGAGIDGSAAAGIAGADGAVLLQTIPVEPGQTYLVGARARVAPRPRPDGARLSVRYRTSAGDWHPDRSLESQTITAGVPGWETLLLTVVPPAGAASLTVMLGVERGAPDEIAWFDQVVCHLVPPEVLAR